MRFPYLLQENLNILGVDADVSRFNNQRMLDTFSNTVNQIMQCFYAEMIDIKGVGLSDTNWFVCITDAERAALTRAQSKVTAILNQLIC